MNRDITAYHQIYFLGIGGIGMSALALYFLTNNIQLAGYDRTSSDITAQLEQQSVEISYQDNEATIPNGFLNPESVLVVYTPAIPTTSNLFKYFQSNGYKLVKRSEVLGLISKQYTTLAVAGTHGKTSTSTLTAHLLVESGINSFAILGGISSNYNSNYINHNGVGKKILVVEADEYDRSFLQLTPSKAVITAIEADHLDIYGSMESLNESFSQFANQIQEGLIVHKSFSSFIQSHQTITYSANPNQEADAKAINIRIENGKYVFDLQQKNKLIKDLLINTPGKHNIENAIAAIVLTQNYIKDENILREALSTFKGVKRRLETIYKSEDFTFYDDYAHHPTEIEATLQAIKELHPTQKITVIFQPHLYSRTKDFASGFGKALSISDSIILLPIYPARELPIEGVSSQLILDEVDNDQKFILEKEDIIGYITSNKPAVLVTLGAGNIDALVKPLLNAMTS